MSDSERSEPQARWHKMTPQEMEEHRDEVRAKAKIGLRSNLQRWPNHRHAANWRRHLERIENEE